MDGKKHFSAGKNTRMRKLLVEDQVKGRHPSFTKGRRSRNPDRSTDLTSSGGQVPRPVPPLSQSHMGSDYNTNLGWPPDSSGFSR